MGLLELLAVAVGLSMDAFAVSICKGLSVKRVSLRQMLIVGLYFGGFQALMPYLGYLLGSSFSSLVASVDHWIAFVLLCIIGGNMVRESFGDEEEEVSASFSPAAMLPLAVATSIDALAIGVTFAFLSVDIGPAVGFIGCTTLVLSAIGVWVGGFFGDRWKAPAERFGGIVLILMGCKILLEHLGIFVL